MARGKRSGRADAPWPRFLAKARRFELRLARLDWKLADDFVALFAEYSRVLLIVMDEARARGTARGVAAGLQEMNAQLDRLAESESRVTAALADLQRSPAPPGSSPAPDRGELPARRKPRPRAR